MSLTKTMHFPRMSFSLSTTYVRRNLSTSEHRTVYCVRFAASSSPSSSFRMAYFFRHGLIGRGNWLTGFRSTNPFNNSTSSVIVALIKNDWNIFGRKGPLNICRTSSSCPYDSTRSASSMTRESRKSMDNSLVLVSLMNKPFISCPYLGL